MPPASDATTAPHAIGEMARRTGLTVRALRHYEAEGLVAPSARTAAGHRRYTGADVARLQTVVSLRAVGLPLADIRRLLGGPDAPDALAVVERHLAPVRARLAAESELADRLDRLAAHLRRAGAADTDTLLHLIHLTTVFERHYTPEQLARLQDRAAALGQDAIADVQAGWARLFAALDRLRTAGADPAGPEAQALAAQARELTGAFTGGDAGIDGALNRAVVADRSAMYAAWGITGELGAYYDRVMSAAAPAP